MGIRGYYPYVGGPDAEGGHDRSPRRDRRATAIGWALFVAVVVVVAVALLL